jgi:hypothetical protein
MKHRLMRTAAAVVVASLPAVPAFADMLLVPSEYTTIQAAIDAAVDGDEVVIADGVFSGAGNHDLDFGGRAITVRSENGAAACIIDVFGSVIAPRRGFHFHSGETATSVVRGLTIQNAYMDVGPAVLCETASSPMFESCVFLQNTASFRGGAMSVETGSHPVLTDCRFIDNAAGQVGAMAVLASAVTAYDCEFNGNMATGSGGNGNLGGVLVNGSSGTFVRCRFIQNTAVACCGALVVINGGTLDVQDCEFLGNSNDSGDGAGVVVQHAGSSATFTNCLFAGNSAGSTGGGVWVGNDADASLVNCAVTGNTADEGGDGLVVYSGANVSLENSLIWGNGPDEIIVANATFTADYSDIEGGWAGTGNLNADPVFVDPDGADDDPNTLEDNDYRLAAGSPCIDAGDNLAVPVGIATDLDGNPRIVDDPDTTDTGSPVGAVALVDMGPYEHQPVSPCASDFGGDGSVGTDDLLQLLAQWGECGGCPEDLDGSGTVDTADLLALLAAWGPCP